MRCGYKSAFIGGIPLGVGLLFFVLMGPPAWEWELLFLLSSGCSGALLAYFCYRSSTLSFSLTKGAVVGASVGVTAGVIYYTCSAIIYLVVANSEVVFNTHSMSLTLIGIARLAAAAGLGGLVVALISKVGGDSPQLRTIRQGGRRCIKHDPPDLIHFRACQHETSNLSCNPAVRNY